MADAATIDVGAIPCGHPAAAPQGDNGLRIQPCSALEATNWLSPSSIGGFSPKSRLRGMVSPCGEGRCGGRARKLRPYERTPTENVPPHCGREGLTKGLRAYAALTVTTVSPEGKGRCGDREGHARSPTRRRARRQIPRVQRLPPSCSDRKSTVTSGIARSLRRVLTWARPWNGSQSCSSIRSRILL